MPANPCPICGQPIMERAKGSRHGNPPKTCSESCRKERARRIEKERYHRIKGTAAWKNTRKTYLAKLRAKLDSDPDFAAIFLAEAAARQRDWIAKLRREDPARHTQIKAEKRARARGLASESYGRSGSLGGASREVPSVVSVTFGRRA